MKYSRIDLTLLYPPFVAKLEQLEEVLQHTGAVYYVTSGLRTVDEQDKLYTQGRTSPGQIVTNAKGGQSAHNFGLAVDFCRDADLNKAGLQPDWNVKSYKLLAQKAEEIGLEAGLHWQTFQDAPHIQLPLSKKGIKLSQLLTIYRKNKDLKEVFRFLDQYSW
jgi:peptidoglycan L-alanyl-D-glutamate endopeptidase CwlK